MEKLQFVILNICFATVLMAILFFMVMWITRLCRSKQSHKENRQTASAFFISRNNRRKVQEWPGLICNDDGSSLPAKVKDICQVGAFVVCEKPMALGEIIKLILLVPGDNPLSLSGQVVWCNYAVSDDRVLNRGMRIRLIWERDELRRRYFNVLLNAGT